MPANISEPNHANDQNPSFSKPKDKNSWTQVWMKDSSELLCKGPQFGAPVEENESGQIIIIEMTNMSVWI